MELLGKAGPGKANIGRKRKCEEPIAPCSELVSSEHAERLLQLWIWIWLILITGIIAFPIVLGKIWEINWEKRGKAEVTAADSEASTVWKIRRGAGLQKARPSTRSRNKEFEKQRINMESKGWVGDNFSQTREQKLDASSSSPVEELSPHKVSDLQSTSVYDSDEEVEGRKEAPGVRQVQDPFGGPSNTKEQEIRLDFTSVNPMGDIGKGKEKERAGEGSVGAAGVSRDWNLPTSINMVQPLLLFRSPGAPYFDGTNATSFIQHVTDLFEDCQVPKSEWKTKLVRYCTHEVRRKVEGLPEFTASGEPSRLFRAIKLEYKDVDDIQRRYTIKTLDDVVREGQQLPEERLREYLDTFNDVSSELEKKGILSAYDRGMKFMMGLPPFLRVRVGERLHFNPLDPETVRYKDCYAKAVEIVRDRRNLRELESYSQEGTCSRPPPGHKSILRPSQQGELPKPEPVPVQQNDDDLIRKFMGLNISMNEVRS
jgi:hypothetical protein